MYFRFCGCSVCTYSRDKNMRREKGVYSKWLPRRQHQTWVILMSVIAQHNCSSLPTDTGKTDECFMMCPQSSSRRHNTNDSVALTVRDGDEALHVTYPTPQYKVFSRVISYQLLETEPEVQRVEMVAANESNDSLQISAHRHDIHLNTMSATRRYTVRKQEDLYSA